MQETILAISGKPGLYKLIARGNASLIVEAIDETHRRQPAGARDRVTSLGDVTMYTEADDVPLMLVFQNISDALQGGETPFNYKQATVEELEKFIRQTATTLFHPVGTARMGSVGDATAVVDSQLRVQGVSRLRVVDASVMPTLTSGHTMAPTIYIAERAAEFITR